MPSSCDICWHQNCFSRSAEAMVLIIQSRSERHWDVNEKYTDSDLCKVSQQMTELTNSSQGAVKAVTEGGSLAAQDSLKELNVLSRSGRCQGPLALSDSAGRPVGWKWKGIRKVTEVAHCCLSSSKPQLQREKNSGLSSAQAPGELEQVKRPGFDSFESVEEFL